MPPSVYDTDTAVRFIGEGAPGPGRWRVELSDRWNIGDKLNGGYLLGATVRAMGGAIAATTGHPHPLTVTAHFFRPGQPGPADIDVEIIRVGRKLSTATGALIADGKERIRVMAAFGDLGDATGQTTETGAPPDLPPPEQCPLRVPDPPGAPVTTLAEQVINRMHPETGWLSGIPSGTARCRSWVRFADGREPDVWALPFFADSLPPSVFEVLEDRSWVPTIELTVHVRRIPTPGWLRIATSTRFLIDGYFEEDCEIWDSSDRLVAASRQLGMVFRP